MSTVSDSTSIEFTSRQASLSTAEMGEPPYTVHGVAIGANDTTIGSSRTKKFWPAEELKQAADSLQGTSLVVNHNNGVSGVVGQVTKAGYKDGTGVIYEAELYEEDIAEKVSNGLMEVSIRGYHDDVDNLEENDDGAKVVRNITFDNLSIVTSGAAPSNEIDIGEHAELSAAELAAATDELDGIELQSQYDEGDFVMYQMLGNVMRGRIEEVSGQMAEVSLYMDFNGSWVPTGNIDMFPLGALSEWNDAPESEELQEMEPGMWVQSNGANGIIMEVADGSATIDVYEDVDGTWRPVGETEEYDLDSLESWDVDESNVGSMKDTEENAEFSKGDFVTWDSSGGPAHGKIVEVRTSGEFDEEIDGDVTVTASEDSPAALIELYQNTEDGWTAVDTMVAHKLDSLDMWDHEEAAAGTPEWSSGDLVRWQVEPDMFGQIVHVDDEKDIVMVEVHERVDGELKSTGFTITAGYGDIVPFTEAEASMLAVTTPDTQQQSSNLDEDLDAVYSEWQDHVNMTASELQQWSTNPCSRQASVDPEAVIRRNLRLLEKNKDEWTDGDINDAKRTISFISRMSDEANEPDEPRDGPNGCPSEWAISLLNWAHNPFESMPERPDSDLEDVEEVTLADGGNGSVAMLQDYEMHDVSFDGAVDQDWNRPDLEDFMEVMDVDAAQFDDLSDEQKNAIADHFFISSTGFPPENYGDLNLPVVEPQGELNINALAAAKGGRGVSAVEGLDSEMEDEIVRRINELANSEFGRDWGMEEASKHGSDGSHRDMTFDSKDAAMEAARELDLDDVHSMGDKWMPGATHEDFLDAVANQSGHAMDEDEEEMTRMAGVTGSVSVLTGDDLRSATNGESEMDSTLTNVITMNIDELEGQIEELDEPAVVEQSEVEELRQKANKYEDISEDISELRERTAVLDDVERSQVDELADGEDPVVVESARIEELESEAEQVKRVYASNLADEVELFEADELCEKYDLSELREKHEEHVGDLEAELSDPSPKSGDVDEEELEDERSEEELEDKEVIEQEQERLKAMLSDD